jgi:hypothetical protein
MVTVNGIPGCLISSFVAFGSLGGVIYLINLIVDGING